MLRCADDRNISSRRTCQPQAVTVHFYLNIISQVGETRKYDVTSSSEAKISAFAVYLACIAYEFESA